MKIKTFRSLFNRSKNKKSKDLRILFPKENHKTIIAIPKHPLVTPLIKDNIYAYLTFFLTDDHTTQRILNIINKHYSSNYSLNTSENVIVSCESDTIAFNIYKKFEGRVVRIITNSEDILKVIWSISPTPITPWVSFPEMDPESLGQMQGDFEFYWEWMWLPFWESIDFTERKEFLKSEQAPSNWVDFFIYYEEQINSKMNVLY
ncbi:hypothetical protein V2154_11005 [Ewingella sp. CoE-038-23]|uniref:hypothetical protein n=1 Tax=Ewingella docleensis TaxID=3118588 RepID=UPI0033654596